MKPVTDTYQLGSDAKLIALPAHAAFQHIGHTQSSADGSQIFITTLEAERRHAAGDVQIRRLSQLIQQLFGQAVREVFVLGIRAHVDERQHGDGPDGLLLARWRLQLWAEEGHSQRKDQHPDDRVVDPATGAEADYFRLGIVQRADQSLGRPVEDPAQDQGDREACRHRDDQEP